MTFNTSYTKKSLARLTLLDSLNLCERCEAYPQEASSHFCAECLRLPGDNFAEGEQFTPEVTAQLKGTN
jgi:hypothetical protein